MKPVAVDVDDMTAAARYVRERGLRLSAARRLVLEALVLAERPISAEAIARGLEDRFPRSDLASVYRNLETLQRIGLVQHVHLGHGPGLYALARGAGEDYLVCESCGGARAVPSAALEGVRALVRERFAFEPRFDHFPIFGLCPACQAGSSQHEPPESGRR